MHDALVPGERHHGSKRGELAGELADQPGPGTIQTDDAGATTRGDEFRFADAEPGRTVARA